jgi:hypothetical protein
MWSHAVVNSLKNQSNLRSLVSQAVACIRMQSRIVWGHFGNIDQEECGHPGVILRTATSRSAGSFRPIADKRAHHACGYQPAQKWLKDRRGRSLSWQDIGHYQKVIKILSETDTEALVSSMLWEPGGRRQG